MGRERCLAFLCLVQHPSLRLMLIIQLDAWAGSFLTDAALAQLLLLQGHAKTVHSPIVSRAGDLIQLGGSLPVLQRPFRRSPSVLSLPVRAGPDHLCPHPFLGLFPMAFSSLQ
jgi:hypothetical protein